MTPTQRSSDPAASSGRATGTVLVLGAGQVGAAAAAYAGRSPVTGHLVVADRSADAAGRALQAAGCDGEAISLDITDASALRALLSRVDVVLNCVGPYYRFGPLVLGAAVDTATTYLDVCDDWEPTLEALDRYGAAAVAAGMTAVIGHGASPGTSNLIARAAVEALPDCSTLLTGWSLDDQSGDPEGAANHHWLEQASGLVRVWRDGRYRDERPLSEVPVHLAEHPPRTALLIGHPEAVTLPRRYPQLRTCLNTMTLPGPLVRALQQAGRAVDDGLSVVEASRLLGQVHAPGVGPSEPEYPGVWAIATACDGSSAHAWLSDYGTMTDMGTVTAAPLVAGMELLLTSGAPHGVLTPEEAFTVPEYFPALAAVAGIGGPVLALRTQP